MARRILFFLLAMPLACLAAWAFPEDDSYTRLARISFIEGSVSFQHTSEVDWSTASVNLPLEPGDRIYTGQDGRAEIEFDDGSVFRLAENTDTEILSLKEDLIQLRLLVGLSTLTVASDTDFEINTPAAAFNPKLRGVYRFDVIENGDTDAIVRKGELEAANNEFSRRIESGDLLHVSQDSGNAELSRYNGRDQWDEWTDRRDADLRAYASRGYLPGTVYMGVSEMDRYGRWVTVDTYGTAWVPFDVDMYWSPYSIGRWCYRPLFGWTWVSYEPWGWLPYHYGRWYRSARFGWCWLPGPAFSFNFWSPGLVTFYSGAGWISWCPLGPGDYYDINHYHFNRGIYSYQLSYVRALHTRAPGDPFNRDSRGAFRIVQIDQFRNGSFDERHGTTRWGNIDKPWRQGTLVRERLTVQPTASSFSAAPDRPAIRPRIGRTLPVIVRANPAIDSGNRERYTRITNPQIPAARSRIWRSRNEMETTDTGNGPKPNVTRVPQGERIDRGTQDAPGTRQPEQGRRSTSTYRQSTGSGSPENRRDGSVDTGRTAPAARPENRAPSAQPSSPRWHYERITPEQKQTPQPPPETKPRAEERPQSNYVEPRSNRGNGVRVINAGAAPEGSGSPAQAAPPRQSNPSPERNSGVRPGTTATSPSNSRNSGNASSTVKSSGKGSLGRWSGGGERKANESGSSGGGHNRR